MFKDNDEHITTIQILQTSDLHGKFLRYDYALDRPRENGSFAAVATAIHDLRLEYPQTILIDTGDTFQGNYNELFRDKPGSNPMIQILNELKYASYTLGNHEFNYGLDYTKEIAKHINAPVLAANLYGQDAQRLFKPYIIHEVEGIKVAIVGFTTPNILRWDGDNIEDATITMPLDEMEKIWQEIEGRADLYVFASHLALNDTHLSGDGYEHLIARYPQFKVILLAHTHQVYAFKKNGAAYVQPGSSGEYISQVLIRFKRGENGTLVFDDLDCYVIATKDVEEDKELIELTEPAHQMAIRDARIGVGYLIGGNLIPDSGIFFLNQAQVALTPLISFVNDVQRFYAKADVSMATLFHIETNLMAGEITKAGLSRVYCYNNVLRSYNINGLQLRALMEWSARYFNRWREGDLTISFAENIPIYEYGMFGGVFYEVDISQVVGERITKLTWPDGRLVQDDESFILAIDDFRAKGYIEHDLFPNGEVEMICNFQEIWGEEADIKHLLMRYILEEKRGFINNHINKPYNNFKVAGYHWDEELRAAAIHQINNGAIVVPTSENRLSFHTRAIRAEDLY